METLIIFVPCVLYNEGPGNLYGVVQETKEECVKSYYILGKKENCDKENNVIGYYGREKTPRRDRLNLNWVLLGLKGSEFVLHEVVSDGVSVDMSRPCQIVCIIYDHKKFVRSEFLSRETVYGDHFKTLTSRLGAQTTPRYALLDRVLVPTLLLVLNVMLKCIGAVLPVLKYTTLGLHLQQFLQSLAWVLHSDKVSVKVANYMVATLVDVCGGMLLLYWLSTMASAPSELLLESGEVVVRTLRDLLQWLMGIPAGLKLNLAFNNMLGGFFMYHINLWWTFLVVAKPLLEVTFHMFLYLGRLGVTFQAAILADLLALVSFHIYCIYVYAARLYNLQVSGLVALWRLFLGRKHNPLRERVDSCQYSPDQLFVGTLAFTILLFLLPTTFMYYVVFTTLRLVVVGFGGLLTRIRYILQCLPLYVSSLWLLRSTSISSTVHLTVRARDNPGPLLLSVQPVLGSWWRTVQNCMPEPVAPPPPVEWGKMIGNLVWGRLIYPV